jgi:hypothetical protein
MNALSEIELDNLKSLILPMLQDNERLLCVSRERRYHPSVWQLLLSPMKFYTNIAIMCHSSVELAPPGLNNLLCSCALLLVTGVMLVTITKFKDFEPYLIAAIFVLSLVLYFVLQRIAGDRAIAITNHRIIYASLAKPGILGTLDLRNLKSVEFKDHKHGRDILLSFSENPVGMSGKQLSSKLFSLWSIEQPDMVRASIEAGSQDLKRIG